MKIKLAENKKALQEKGVAPYEFDRSKLQQNDKKT